MQDLRQDPSRQLLQHEARCPDRGQGSSPEPGEEEALLRAFARSRDPLLQALLSARYRPLVERIARSFRSREPLQDLVQVGYIGLLQALNRYDPDRGIPFPAYAAPLVAGEIRHYLRDHANLIRPPRWLGRVMGQLDQVVHDFWTAHGRSPTVEEIARAMNVTPEGVRSILQVRAIHRPLSLEAPALRRALRHQYYETFRLPIEDRIMLLEALERLQEIERKVIYALFYLDLTETEVGRRLRLSQRQVSRVLTRALQRIAQILRESASRSPERRNENG